MSRKLLTLIASLLTVAALAPAIANAAVLHGAPTMRQIAGGHVRLQFAVDEKLPTKNGKVTTKVTIDGKNVTHLARTGRHGTDFVYTARVPAAGLTVNEKYEGRFHFKNGTFVRQVKLHPLKG